MPRAGWMAIFCMAAMSTGCSMCDCPYDYCYPTYTGGCGEPCRTYERVGSVFTGPLYVGGGTEYELHDADQHEPTPASMEPEAPEYYDESDSEAEAGFSPEPPAEHEAVRSPARRVVTHSTHSNRQRAGMNR